MSPHFPLITLAHCWYRFQVFTFLDLTSKDMKSLRRLIEAIAKKCPGAYTFFYFAGHGFEFHGEQYLTPIDATKKTMVSSSLRVKRLQQCLRFCPSRMHTIVLDCCRTL